MPIVYCGWCGKQKHIVPAKVRPINFCNRQCSGLYRKGKPFHTEDTKLLISNKLKGIPNPNMSAIAKQRVKDKAPHWAGDKAVTHTGRHRAQAYYELKPCEVCGKEPGGHKVHRHHRDGNTLNNAPENIMFLCAKHHFELHRKGAIICHQ